jgi:hypothetical protein
VEPTTPQMVIDLCDLPSHEFRLSDWEVEFVDSVSRQLDRGSSLSEKQTAKITSIWRKVYA